MLKIDGGRITVNGERLVLWSEFVTLTHDLLAENVFTESQLDSFIEIAKKSNEEIEKEIKEKTSKISADTAETLKEKLMDIGAIEFLKKLFDE